MFGDCLYRERWALAEICIYAAEFRRPHEETEDTRASWDNLGEYLKEEKREHIGFDGGPVGL